MRALPFTQLGRVTLMLLRLAPGNEHIGASLEPWMDDLLAIGDTAEGHEIFTGLIVPYLVTVSAAPESELQEIAYLLGPKVEEHYVKTTAGMIEARGRAEVLLEQVSDKWGTPSAQTEDTIRSGTGRELRVWAVAILKEKFLERFLAAPDDPRYNYL